MGNKDFIDLAIASVVAYYNDQADKTDKSWRINEDNVYVVWLVKALQNNKALLSTNVPDEMYYEFTWNGDKNEGYLDAYKKVKNTVIRPVEEEEI